MLDLEYDPSTSLLVGLDNVQPNAFQSQSQGAFDNVRGGDRGRGRGRGQRGDRGGGQRGRGGRTEFSSDRPNFDRNKTTIVVENIPEEKFSEEAVREFFSEFGNVQEITMKAYKHLAIVKYDDWNSANAAYSSPKVIFDNRFVKVYWYSGEGSLPKKPSGIFSNGGTDNANGATAVAKPSTEPQMNLEEFARKQEEIQKAHEEKMKKKAEMEARQKELEKRQEELLRSQAEEKRKLMERLAAKTGKSGSPIAIDSHGATATDQSKSSQTDVLKAQLAALEAEAKSLGIDPNQTEEPQHEWAARGRGRGAYRGRGPFVPRGRGFDRGRGAFRGRGGAPFSGVNPYKLDNRPRKIALTGVDFTEPEKDENLRQYLLVCINLRFE